MERMIVRYCKKGIHPTKNGHKIETYRERWIKQIRNLCEDFCIPSETVEMIILSTKETYKGRERDYTMYNYAHRQMMSVL